MHSSYAIRRTNGDAYDLYLQARYSQRLATEEDYLFSRDLLESAVVRDPNFALAYASLAGNYAMMLVDGLERPNDAWPQVRRYMRQALEIDPTLPEAVVMEHAMAFLFDWDWAGAEAGRRRLLASPIGGFDPQFAARSPWSSGRLGGRRRRCSSRDERANWIRAVRISRCSRRITCSETISSTPPSRCTSTRSGSMHRTRMRSSVSPRRGCAKDDWTRRSRPGAARTR